MDIDLLPAATTLLLIATVVSLASSIYAFRQHNYPVAIWCGWLMLAISIYSAGYAGELSSTTLQQADNWIRLQFMGAAYIPCFVILMTLCYRLQSQPPLVIPALLLTVSSLILVLVMGNSSHHLVYRLESIHKVHQLTLSQFSIGPGYYLHLVYLNLSWVLTLSLLLQFYRTIPAYRKPIAFIAVGTTAPWLGYLVNIANYSSLQLDFAPLCFLITSFCYWIGLFKYRFANLSPIARDHIFEALNKPLLVLNEQLQIVDFNRKASDYFGCTAQRLLGQDVSRLAALPNGLHHLRHSQNEMELLEFTHNQQAWELAIYPLRQQQQRIQGFILVFQEVTERVQLIETLRTHAERDTLTNLFNRRLLMGRLPALLAEASEQTPLSLILFDVDHFKAINDAQGHLAGDQALINIGRLVQHTLPATALAARYGGDEFLIVLPRCTAAEATQLANILNEQCQARLGFSLSLGITQSTGQETTEQLIQRADTALYQAKSQGRARALTCSQVMTPCGAG